jgi:hypothetical protein
MTKILILLVLLLKLPEFPNVILSGVECHTERSRSMTGDLGMFFIFS